MTEEHKTGLNNIALNIRKYESIIISAMFTVLVLISFVNETVYEKAGRYSSLFMFAVLCVLAAAHLGEMWNNRDIRCIIVILTGIIAMTNLIIIHSNKGAVLIPSDLVLMALLASYISLSQTAAVYMAAVGSILTVIWYVDVRWTYNFNMAGLTFMLFMIMGVIYLEFLKEDHKYDYLLYLQILMYATAFIYATLYHSRCAMAGIAAFGIFVLCGPLIRRSKLLFTLILIITTGGSIAFTILYLILAGKGINISFLYKDLLSGRQQIWKELWGAFFEHPLTGIGSSYVLESFDIFEVHNGFFDIMTVHGMIVFALVFIMILSAVNEAWLISRDKETGKNYSILALAAVFAMFTASFFENFFITPPYSAFFFYFLLLCRME